MTEVLARSGVLTRALPISVRAVDEDAREVEFTAATENPVDVGLGMPEVLRLGGMDLDQFRRNPVVLNSHARFDVQDVVGRGVEVSLDGRQLRARIRFSRATESGRAAFDLVREGALSAVSIGYSIPDGGVRELREGESDGEGEARVEGPALVVDRSTLLEISVVPIPADPAALRRALGGSDMDPRKRKKRKARQEEGEEESEEEETSEDESSEDESSEESEGEGDDDGAMDEEDDERAMDEEDERSAEELKQRRDYLLTFCPADLREYAEQVVLRDYLLWDKPMSVRTFKRALRAKRAEESPPAGTPEPPIDRPASRTGQATKTQTTNSHKGSDLDAHAFVRLLSGGRGA